MLNFFYWKSNKVHSKRCSTVHLIRNGKLINNNRSFLSWREKEKLCNGMHVAASDSW